MVPTVHQTWGRERNFLSRRIGCLPARPPAWALRWLAPLYRKLSRRVGCLPARPLASALRRLAPLYRKLSRRIGGLPARPLASALRWLAPFIESFLLHQIPSCFPAGPRIHTGLPVLPERRRYIYPSPLSWKCSLLPVKGSRTSPQTLCPMCESPSGKRERNSHKREVYY